MKLSSEAKENCRILYLANAIPAGNLSSEEQSLLGKKAGYYCDMFQLLQDIGLNVSAASDFTALLKCPESYEYVFTLLNRAQFRNSEAFASSICEYLGVPYLGAHPETRTVMDSKQLAKLFCNRIGIPTPAWKTYRDIETLNIPPDFPGPYFIKPLSGADSFAVDSSSLQGDWAGAKQHCQSLFHRIEEVVVEQFVNGINVTTPAIGGMKPWILPSLIIETELEGNIQTSAHKLYDDGNRVKTVLDDSTVIQQVETYVAQLYDELSPIDYCRTDFRLDPSTGKTWFLEMNISCNLDYGSSFIVGASAAGLTRIDVVEHVLYESFRRQNLRT
jgi:D-alanine-D-alanine ligase